MNRNALIRALRDTAQSASNAIASNVSGPVDLIAAGLRGVGLPIPQNPVGGSQWMAERGLTAPVQQGVAQVIGDTMGLAGPALVANFAPQIASALNRGAQNLAAPRTLHPETGAIVWHGSPHKFDRFDSSKIGTGEGAQAYGHGLYLAESPDVAKGYQAKLTVGDNYVDGELLDAYNPKHYLAQALSDAGGNKAEAADFLRTMSLPGGNKSVRDTASKALDLLNNGESPSVQFIKPEGALYKVDLPDEQIARMLDWDKPLSQQAPEVQSLVEKLGFGRSSTTKGEDIYDRVASEALQGVRYAPDGTYTGVPQGFSEYRQASQMLRDAGIPGIRYLDGGSRGAGQGTSNFVVFPGNENILQILERNGQPLGLMGVR